MNLRRKGFLFKCSSHITSPKTIHARGKIEQIKYSTAEPPPPPKQKTEGGGETSTPHPPPPTLSSHVPSDPHPGGSPWRRTAPPQGPPPRAQRWPPPAGRPRRPSPDVGSEFGRFRWPRHGLKPAIGTKLFVLNFSIPSPPQNWPKSLLQLPPAVRLKQAPK